VRLPEGFAASGVSSGIKSGGGEDLGILAAAEATAWTGVFTRNAAAAAPVRWCRAALGAPVRAIVVNSGCANACTGEAGVRAVRDTAAVTAAELGCTPGEVLVASTGPIGVPLPVDRIASGVPVAAASLGSDVLPFARSILTTDTSVKLAKADVGTAEIVGVAKGAAMIAPNMATMLAFIVTDGALPEPALKDCLSTSAASTFNRISIDACESTNDSVFLLSSGSGPPVDRLGFRQGLDDVCASLSHQIVSDAEGGTKVMRIGVSGAPDAEAAAGYGRAIAASDLWRSAVHGADPNWGRILAALGTDRNLDLTGVSISIAGVSLFDRGEPVGDVAAAASAMRGPEIEIEVQVGSGDGAAEILAADLTPDYVKLNAEGST
jgi:glutamate N-acetyltransferase/amino-acid N-acetyltransferase